MRHRKKQRALEKKRFRPPPGELAMNGNPWNLVSVFFLFSLELPSSTSSQIHTGRLQKFYINNMNLKLRYFPYHPCMILYIYLHLVDFYGFHVGK